ncbi:hypothetical protein [Mycobacterium haemophilum]
MRTVTYAEDHRQIRTGNEPHVVATLRNAPMSVLSLDGPQQLCITTPETLTGPRRRQKRFISLHVVLGCTRFSYQLLEDWCDQLGPVWR